LKTENVIYSAFNDTYYLETVADGDGKFSNLEFPIEINHLCEEFLLVASQVDSELFAETRFTDAPKLNSITPTSGTSLEGTTVILMEMDFQAQLNHL